MSLNYAQQIESTARRIRRRRWAAIACWTFVGAVAAVLALIAIDWRVGVYHVTGRAALTLLLIVAAIAVWRLARRAARKRVTPLDVAFELERRYSEHRSLLASALEFSAQEGNDPTAGSSDLRRAVVVRASVALESIDLEAIVPRAPLRRAVVAALAAAIVLAVPAALAPQGVAIGLVRLFNPLGDAEWPRRHDLEFVDPPSVVPIGGDFEATLRDRRGRLPRSVEVEYRTWRDGRWQYESQTYAASGEKLEVRRPSVQEPFEYRAHGGDHQSMPWRRVETAPAPAIESLEMKVHPPAYTGLAAHAGAEPLRIVEGSTLELHGRVNIPITSGELRARDQAVALVVGEGGLAFQAGSDKWKPRVSSDWSIFFTTPQGMKAEADRQLSVEVVPDRPPSVEIAEPAEDLFVLPEASVELSIQARDDLAVRAVDLTIARDSENGDQSPPMAVELYRGPAQPMTRPLDLSHILELSTLTPPAGSIWEVRVRAEDCAGQSGQSARALRIRVISREEFVRRIDAMLSRLAAASERALDDQREARRRMDASPSSDDDQKPLDRILGALARQRAVADSLAGGRHAALELSKAVAGEYRRNHWPGDESPARMEQLADRLQSLASDELPVVEAALATLARSLQQAAGGGDLARPASDDQSLQDVRGQQDKVIAALEDMVRELSQWDEVQQHQREIAELKAEQATLLEQTQSSARTSLEDAPSDKKSRAGQNRRAQQLAGQQRALASRLGGALARMRESASALAATAPADAGQLNAAVRQAAQGRLQSEARAAAEDLAQRRFGQAAEKQRAVGAQLHELMDRLAARGSPAGSKQAAVSKQQIERLDAALGRLVAAQRSLIEEARQLAARKMSLAPLAKRQATVRGETRSQAEQIERFPIFARLLRTAADTMEEAETRAVERETEHGFVEIASRALAQLRLLADAVRQQRELQSQPPQPRPPQGPKPGDGPGQEKDADRLQALQLAAAQLALLRTMQAELQSRTIELERLHTAGEIDAAALQERSAKLAAEQRELTKLAESLAEDTKTRPEDETSNAENSESSQ